jgi:hypothetical protein
MTQLDDETLGEYFKRADEIRNTVPHPDEDKYVLSDENMKVTHDFIDALKNKDWDKIAELETKIIFPLKTLKSFGQEFVIRHGLPTITAEIANDTEWLK